MILPIMRRPRFDASKICGNLFLTKKVTRIGPDVIWGARCKNEAFEI
jgi:hypothetical protein